MGRAGSSRDGWVGALIFWAKPLSVPTGPPLRGSHRCHERVRAQPRSSGASPCPAQPLTMSGDTRCPLLVPRGRTALGTSHNSGGSHCPHPRQHSLVPPPRGDPPASPPYQRGCATVKRRCRRMLWFIRSFLKKTGELRGEPRGDVAGEAPGERCVVGSMARFRDPRAGGEAPLAPVRSRKRAAVPAPAAPPGNFPSPSRPAPGKLNNCLAPAAGAGSGSPPGVPGGPGTWPLAGPVPPATLLSPRRQLLLKGQGCFAWTLRKMPHRAPRD